MIDKITNLIARLYRRRFNIRSLMIFLILLMGTTLSLPREPIKIVLVGNSITYGIGTSEGKSYVSTLRKDLPGELPMQRWGIYNEAVSGSDTKDWSNWVNSKILAHKPNIVVIMLGTNDCSPRSNAEQHVPIADYESNLRNMVKAIRALNNGSEYNQGKPIVILMAPPPIDNTKVSETIRDNDSLILYAQSVRKLAEELQVPLVDNYSNMLVKGWDYYSSNWSGDGIHPNDDGHNVIYDKLKEKIKESMSKEFFASNVLAKQGG